MPKSRRSKDCRPPSTPDLGDFGFVRQVPPILLALIFKYFGFLLNEDFSVRREFMSVELFAGEQAISKAIRKDFPAASFDKRYDLNQDLATTTGFALALNLVLRILNHGMLWTAPVCSSWVWISRSRTGRSTLNASGNLKHLSVRTANRMVDFTVLLIVVAYARGVEVYLEQPCSSVMPHYPCVEALFAWITMYKLPTSLGNFGADSTKPVNIFTSESSPRVHFLIKHGGSGPAKGAKRALCTRDAEGRVSGIKKALKSSQHYPPQFGEVVARAASSSLYERVLADWFPE